MIASKVIKFMSKSISYGMKVVNSLVTFLERYQRTLKFINFVIIENV